MSESSSSSPFRGRDRTAARYLPGASTVYVVDDDPLVAEVVGAALHRFGYQARSFEDAVETLNAVLDASVDLVVTDIGMPVHDGLWLLDRINTLAPDVGVLVLTASEDPRTAVECMKRGAIDYLTKPFRLEELEIAIAKALNKQRLIRENALYRQVLEARTEQLQHALKSSSDMFQSCMQMLVRALDWRERETKNHSCRVALSAVALARQIGLDEPDVQGILLGGLLHDIGKIGVPDAILMKSGPLDPEEWDQMRQHPAMGYDILIRTSYLSNARDIVLHHHERYDGSGYPDGLKGAAIPLPARIFSIADTLDAIMSDRPYRHGQSFHAAAAEIACCSGSQFDPAIVKSFQQITEPQWRHIRRHASRDAWHYLKMTLTTEAASEMMFLTSSP